MKERLESAKQALKAGKDELKRLQGQHRQSIAILCVLCVLCGKGFSQTPAGADYTATSLRFLLQNPPQPVNPTEIFASRLDNPGPCTYHYWVVTNAVIGNASPSGPAIVANAACTLTNGNRIGWTAATGAASYDVLRTTSPKPPTGACNCAVATGVAGTTATDTGTLSAYTVTTFDPQSISCLIDNEQSGPGAAALLFHGCPIPNASLKNSSININSQTCILGGSCTIPTNPSFPLLAPNGSDAAPSYSFAAHTGDGMFWTSSLPNFDQGPSIANNGSLLYGFGFTGNFYTNNILDLTGAINGALVVENNWQFNGTASGGPLARGIMPLLDDAQDLGALGNHIRTLYLAGGVTAGLRNITSSSNETANDFTITCDATAAPVTFTLLPTPAPAQTGHQIVVVKKIDATANACIINGNGNGNNIDGSASLSLLTQNAAVVLQFNGTQWNVLAQANTGSTPTGAAGGDLSGTYPNPTVAKVNAVSYPASPSTNTVPVVTGANTVTYEAVPNAALQNSSTTVNGTTCTLGSPCTVTSASAGNISGNVRTVTTTDTATTSDFLIRADATAGAFTETLPASPPANMMLNVKRIDINGGVNITINGNGHNIDGAPTFTISTVGATFGAGLNIQMFFDTVSGTWNIL